MPERVRRSHTAQVWLVRVIVIIALLGAWQLGSMWAGGIKVGVPGPVDVALAFGTTFSATSAWTALGQTLLAWLIGFSISTLLGLIAGAALGASRIVNGVTLPTIDFLRTIPPIAMLAVVAFILGVNLQFEVLFIVLGAVWPILIQTMYGVSGAEPGLVDMARLLRMGPFSRLRFVLLPSAVPFIATGLRLSAVMALLLGISAELLAGVPGVGSEIHFMQFSGQIGSMYVYVLVATLLGALIGFVFVQIERQLKRWAQPGGTTI